MKIIAKHKFASSNYEILEKYVAGIELKGWEVKSIRAQNVNLKNSFCSFKKHELYVSNMHISSWMLEKNDELRARKLLLRKSELIKISTKKEKLKCILIPLNLFWNNGKIKLEIALAKSRNKVDKRNAIKEADIQRRLKKILI